MADRILLFLWIPKYLEKQYFFPFKLGFAAVVLRTVLVVGHVHEASARTPASNLELSNLQQILHLSEQDHSSLEAPGC